MKYKRDYEVITYETGPRSCDRCHKIWPAFMLNQYPKTSRSRPPREVCDDCLEKDKHDGTFVTIMDKWEYNRLDD